MDLLLIAEATTEGAFDLTTIGLNIGLAIFLVILNGFFVAAEFALVKVRPSQIDKMVREKKMFAGMAKWLATRMDHSLSACQLGITMASLALGWVGEPAFAKLIGPVFTALGIESEYLLHIFSFIVAFSVITSLHLVIGEQAPKIFAIRRPEPMCRWCAPLMIFFFYLLYPFMYALNWVTEIILGWLGLKTGGGHGDAPMSEEEIRALLAQAHSHGNLTDSEDTLINNVFEFDDLICRLVMVPRGDVAFLDVNDPFPTQLQTAKERRFTRYPVCDGSLDKVLGVVHMKDFLGISKDDKTFDVKTVMRSPEKVPETMPISKVLRHIQNTHQLLAFVIDEYGTTVGIVTLENILEKIVGAVDDEFDVTEEPDVQEMTDGRFMVMGSTPISEVEKKLGLNLDDEDVDTLAGVLMARSGKIPEKGDKVEFEGAVAEIMEVANDHAERVRFTIADPVEKEDEAPEH